MGARPATGFDIDANLKLDNSGVAVAHLLFAQRTFDAAGDRIADPDDRAKKKDGDCELKGVDHVANLRDFPLAAIH
jgi:hypothetical protein